MEPSTCARAGVSSSTASAATPDAAHSGGAAPCVPLPGSHRGGVPSPLRRGRGAPPKRRWRRRRGELSGRRGGPGGCAWQAGGRPRGSRLPTPPAGGQAQGRRWGWANRPHRSPLLARWGGGVGGEGSGGGTARTPPTAMRRPNACGRRAPCRETTPAAPPPTYQARGILPSHGPHTMHIPESGYREQFLSNR